MGILSGLESFGLGKLKDLDVYGEAHKKEEQEQKKEVKKEPTELELLFDKHFTCPACGKEFMSKVVRGGRVKMVAMDMDLRPKYQYVDVLKYDAVVCPKCGFASLAKQFNYLTSGQIHLIKEQVSANFKGISEPEGVYSYDDAIARHKLALLCTIVKRGKFSEKAYTCLKLAWLYRGKAEHLPKDTKDYDKTVEECHKEEAELINNAYQGFSQAFSKENFPLAGGMDEPTATYLVADLARRTGDYEAAARWISQVIVSRNANERIKGKARDLKDLILEEKEKVDEKQGQETEGNEA